MTDGQRQERIRWLSELSAARRALRAAGWSAPEAIAAQLSTHRVRRFSVWATHIFRRAELAVLFHLQGGRCYLCGGAMIAKALGYQTPEDATRDHVVPRRRRGPDVRNLLAAHRECNERKADREPYPCELVYLAAINARLVPDSTRPRP